MTYREHRAASDRAYLAEMFARHVTASEVARQAGVNRTHLYKLAARVGYQMPAKRNLGNAEWGNAEWQALGR